MKENSGRRLDARPRPATRIMAPTTRSAQASRRQPHRRCRAAAAATAAPMAAVRTARRSGRAVPIRTRIVAHDDECTRKGGLVAWFQGERLVAVVATLKDCCSIKPDRKVNAAICALAGDLECCVDAGHVIARCYGGCNCTINLFPQYWRLNRAGGKWWQLEQRLRAAVKRGINVELHVSLMYADADTRVPCTIVAEVKLGDALERHEFHNGEADGGPMSERPSNKRR